MLQVSRFTVVAIYVLAKHPAQTWRGALPALAAALLPEDTPPPAAAAAAADDDDDVVVVVVVGAVVAKEIRSAETAAVGPADAAREPVTAAGKDLVLSEFTNREPADDDVVVAVETDANVSELMLAVTSARDWGTLLKGPNIPIHTVSQ